MKNATKFGLVIGGSAFALSHAGLDQVIAGFDQRSPQVPTPPVSVVAFTSTSIGTSVVVFDTITDEERTVVMPTGAELELYDPIADDDETA